MSNIPPFSDWSLLASNGEECIPFGDDHVAPGVPKIDFQVFSPGFSLPSTSVFPNYNLPDQAKLVDKSKVVEKGNYLYLVISKNADEIIDTIEKNI